ncbi:MAG: UDP-glucose 4-epimerase GalE [bacterium]
MKTILLTGGAGYIGSHIAVELLMLGYGVVIVDNFTNSDPEVIARIKNITGKNFDYYNVDVANQKDLSEVFDKHAINSVIHLAGLKAVGESVEKPLEYYKNNLYSTLVLCEVMKEHGVYHIVFSSSATVYGKPKELPIAEDHPVAPTNPYGHTKAMIEQIFIDLTGSIDPWQVTILRYFNPIGAHGSGLIGEDPNGVPNNLFPYLSQVASGKLKQLTIHGDDYETPDGTGVRDYIHVVDLANGHLAAIKSPVPNNHYAIYNLGTGKGYSVLESIESFEEACGKKIAYVVGPCREGDVAECYADPSKAKKALGWTAQKSFYDACVDTWHWQRKNPEGY